MFLNLSFHCWIDCFQLPTHPPLRREDTCEAVFNRCAGSPCLSQFTVPHFRTGSPFWGPGSMGGDCPQAHSKQRTSIGLSGNSRSTLLLISGQGSPRPSWITQNLNWVGWSFSCCTPAPSPRNHVPASQPLRPLLPLSHASKCSSRSISKSSGQIYLLLQSQEGWSNRFLEITSISETASLN